MAPSYSILLRPHSDDDGICGLSVTVRLESPKLKATRPLCEFKANTSSVPHHQYTADNMQIFDESGPLKIQMLPCNSQGMHVWTVDRDTVGTVTLLLEVTPRQVDVTTPVGPRVDMRRDQGGLIGSGGWFLPCWPKHERLAFHISWDLSLVSADTRAQWSYGPGPAPTTVEGPIELLLNAIFMVGNINSSAAFDDATSVCDVYWFGDTPAYFDVLRSLKDSVFRYACDVFDDEADHYGIYIRKAPRGIGGNNFSAALLLEYSDAEAPITESQLIALATHELVHNWLYLGPETDGFMNTWHIEGEKFDENWQMMQLADSLGIAHFYSLYLPVRAGLRGIEYFCEVLNGYLCAYYTNPLITSSLRDVENDFYSNACAQSIPYTRGFVYLLFVDALLRQSTPNSVESQGIFDNIVMDITRQNRNRKVTNASSWLSAVKHHLSEDTSNESFKAMHNGEIMRPHASFTFPVAGHVVQLQETEQEQFEIGFVVRGKKVANLVRGSRAELAGLREGDEIVYCSQIVQCLESFERTVSFTANRFGREFSGEFWPRSQIKVASFQAAVLEQLQ